MSPEKRKQAKDKAQREKKRNEDGHAPYIPGPTGEVTPHPLAGIPQPHRSENSSHFAGTSARKSHVLTCLAEGKTARMAAFEVGVHRSTLFNWKEDDKKFAAEWDEALKAGAEFYEDEVRRRATEGTLKPVYQQGELVGHIREFSDNLLIMATKARLPEKYRENVHQTGEMKVVVDERDMKHLRKK